jgi:glucose-1-phosphate adenylyltransferase
MGKTIGMIFSNCRSDVLMDLTANRPIAAVPFGGRYRLLDFPLSNMVNSGIRTVGIITPPHFRPVLDHLKSGKDWFLDRKTGGLFILPGLDYSIRSSDSIFLLKDLIHNIDYLKKDKADEVIMSNCNQIINLNFKEPLELHRQNKADITFIYKDEAASSDARLNELYLEMDETSRIKCFLSWFNLEREKTRKRFLNTFIINKGFLEKLLESFNTTTEKDLLEFIAGHFNEFRVFGYRFTGYTGKIASVQDYFERSMELLNLGVQKELFMGSNRIHTKINDKPPSLYTEDAQVKNSIVATGCKIKGSIENSIVFREATIEKGASVKNSIIMQKCRIGSGVTLENTILDKFVHLGANNTIVGDKNQPVVVKKGASIDVKGGAF